SGAGLAADSLEAVGPRRVGRHRWTAGEAPEGRITGGEPATATATRRLATVVARACLRQPGRGEERVAPVEREGRLSSARAAGAVGSALTLSGGHLAALERDRARGHGADGDAARSRVGGVGARDLQIGEAHRAFDLRDRDGVARVFAGDAGLRAAVLPCTA